MKVQCELCGELSPLGSYRVVEGDLEVTCAACGQTFRGAAERPGDTDSGGPAKGGAPGMRCPKCGDDQPEAAACRSCGLRAERFAAFSADSEEGAAELDALWRACVDRWDDEQAHQRFLEAASTRLLYAPAARRYRQVLRDRPDDPQAAVHLARITRMAEAALLTAAPPRRAAAEGNEPYKNVVVLLMILVVLAGAGAIYLMVRSAGSEPDRPAPVRSPIELR